jgi:hypothetical protein
MAALLTRCPQYQQESMMFFQKPTFWLIAQEFGRRPLFVTSRGRADGCRCRDAPWGASHRVDE